MKRPGYFLLCLTPMALLLFFGCADEEAVSSSEKSITTFSFKATDNPGLSTDVAATVSADHITCTVPAGTVVTSLKPTVVFEGASINPSPNTSLDFSNPVTYTVTAADGSTQSYLATVTVTPAPLSPDHSITSFSFLKADNASLPADIEATINEQNIFAQVPAGILLASLKPAIVHNGASINPVSGSAVDFTLPVTYTVTAENGDTKEYVVTVTHAEAEPSVYVVGTETIFGTNCVRVWKNGTATSLTNGAYNAYAKSIVVRGNTWHVVGHQMVGATYATYWKTENGVMLPTPRLNETNDDATANSIFITDDADVFIAGEERYDGNFVAKVWKNGTPTRLSTKIASYASSVFVSGTNVYVAGAEPGATQGLAARLWTNGTATPLSPEIENSDAGGVFVSDGIVYVGGVVYKDNTAIATVWKNGVADFITPGSEGCVVKSIFVSGGMVYLAGRQIRGKQYNACIWKDGVITFLSTAPNSEATSIFVHNGDIYVAGRESENNVLTAVLWKNGIATTLATNAFATGVTVR